MENEDVETFPQNKGNSKLIYRVENLVLELFLNANIQVLRGLYSSRTPAPQGAAMRALQSSITASVEPGSDMLQSTMSLACVTKLQLFLMHSGLSRMSLLLSHILSSSTSPAIFKQ